MAQHEYKDVILEIKDKIGIITVSRGGALWEFH